MIRTPLLRHATLTAVAFGTAVVLSACGQASDAAPAAAGTPVGDMANMTTSAPEAPSASSASPNEADVAFAQMMIPDHKMMAKMAKMATRKAVSAELKSLAPTLGEGQLQTATALQGLLKDWGKSASMDMAGMEMPGGMSPKDMTMLKSMKGAEFDMMFAEMMVTHHEASIKMAQDEQTNGANTEAKALAAEMVSTQQAQVEQLREIAQM
jgi:uncharacterized protein (DUF305 family)